MAADPAWTRLRRRLGDPVARWSVLVPATIVATLIAATVAFAVGRDDRGRPLSAPYADASYYYAYLPSLWLDGDLDLTDEYRETGNWYRLGRAPTGRPGNVFGIGPAVFSSPAFLAGHGIARATGARADGFSRVEQWLTMWMSVLASVLAVGFAWRVAARRLDARLAGLVAALLVLAGGPVIYYAVRQPGYAHPFATLFAAWLVDAWDASYARERTARTWAYLGALLGAAILARPQLATWGLLLGLAALDDVRARWRARPPDARAAAAIAGAARTLAPRWAAGAAAAAVLVVPQLLAWKAIYGAYYLVPQGPGFMRWDAPAWSEVLFSARNGLLPWAPLYAVAALGLAWGIRRAPRLYGALAAAVALQAIANGAAWDWWAGGSFGGRRFDSTYVAFALGLAALLAPAIAAVAAVARAGRRAARIAAAAAGGATLALCAILAAANLWLAARTFHSNARIGGGTPAAQVIRERVPSPLGDVAAAVSAASNLPARLAFAWRHDAPLGAYDRVVGVHWLGETYPGLNSNPPRREERRPVTTVPPWSRDGLGRADVPDTLAIRRAPARIFVGLNRRGGVELDLAVAHPDGGEAVLRWNGREIARGALGPELVPLSAVIDDVARGVNVLTIDAPRGALVGALGLRARGPY